VFSSTMFAVIAMRTHLPFLKGSAKRLTGNQLVLAMVLAFVIFRRLDESERNTVLGL